MSKVTVAFMLLLGTLLGSMSSLFMANKLIDYRINKLEEIVKERSSVVERVYHVEKEHAVIHEKLKEIMSKLSNLEKRVH